ncbi:unnamed protein product [Heligmosomoides polygyrus]|uniref:Protein-S-isoprenylcysteine O-methyltransferase n=1 Tax=Heligmosomoides polygyrus TaxID=6339 RepID=A0A3P7YFN8_HELPZ|nr:unnamed protein product [Heligmosomoides polygyrus]
MAVLSSSLGPIFPLLLFAVCIPASYYCGRYLSQKPVCAAQATFLGLLCGTSAALFVYWRSSSLALFFCYSFVFSVFHFSEYFFTAISNRRSLQPDSFLLNHSTAYWVAACASWAEFFAEAYFAPFLKVKSISMLGLACCICGEVTRKLAMLHAGNGFTHRLALSKRPDHRLVTTGIYAVFRHPGYTGWFLWSIGTQVILCNPICLFAYAYVSWHFFNERIYDEERDLINFFGEC